MAQTLYRKYRSQRFSEILGQKQVIRILRNSIQRQRLNHAYLFSGPRGTGKTSVARIFAKALNCENLQEGDACAECSACNSIRDGNAMDVIEIDAASNRGIDDIRQLRERVNYAPVSFPYKVYIIDEAHMITGPGFNALLKTLEEPPSHVVFCLCTTEPHKLPLTIISRCIRFDFQRLPADDLANHLGWIAEQEGFSISAEAAAELCNLGEGSARDAISLLEQLSVYCDGGIELTDIRELFQLVDPSQISAIVEQLHAADPSPALASWERLAASGTDAARFLLKIAGELKRLYLEQPRPKLRAALEALWQGVNLLKHDSYPTLVVELALLKAHAALVEEAVQPAAPEETQAPEEESVAPLGEAQQAEAEPAHPEEAAGEHRHRPSTGSPGVPARDSWASYLEAVERARMTTYALILEGTTGSLSAGRLRLVFEQAKRMAYEYAKREDNIKVLENAASEVYGAGTAIVLALADGEGSQAEYTPPVQVKQALREKLPDEVLYDVTEKNEPQTIEKSSLDPAQMSGEAQSLTPEIEDGVVDDSGRKPPTAKDVASLFEAEELDEEE